MFSDVNTPLYYLLLRGALLAGFSGASALVLVNQFAIVAFSAVALWLFARAGRPWFGIAALGLELASPTVLTFGLEGRFYALAQFSCFALSAAVLTRLDTRPRKHDLALFIALAAIASAAHLFGALLAGSLGAALTLISLRTSRANTVAGLTIGATATAVAAIWIVVASAAMFGADGLVNWIPSGTAWIVGQFWFMNRLLSGLTPNVVTLAAAVGVCALTPKARPYAVLFALTAILFYGLPLLASVWRPTVTGRYLAIASPALILVLMFMGWRAFQSQAALARVGASLAAVFLVIATLAAPAVAHRMIWVGRWPYDAADARGGVAGCAQPRVRVYVPAEGATGAREAVHMFSYEHAMNRPDVALVPSDEPGEDVAAYPCRLVGWGEQVFFSLPNASDADVLRELGLTNAQGAGLHVERRDMGFLLLRD